MICYVKKTVVDKVCILTLFSLIFACKILIVWGAMAPRPPGPPLAPPLPAANISCVKRLVIYYLYHSSISRVGMIHFSIRGFRLTKWPTSVWADREGMKTWKENVNGGSVG